MDMNKNPIECPGTTLPERKHEEVFTEEPGLKKRRPLMPLTNVQAIPIGVGKNTDFRHSADKTALMGLKENENPGPVTAPVQQQSVTKPVNVSELNENVQKNGTLGPASLGPNNASSIVVGDQEPAAKETKEEAARPVYHDEMDSEATELSSDSAVSDDGAPAWKSTSQSPLDPLDAKSKSVATTSSDSVIFTNSSSPLKDQDETGNSPSEKTSVQSEISRFILEFDCIEPMGKGGFGRVFKAKEKLTEKNFAIKIVVYKKKSLQEVKALSDLHHSNIVRYYTCWLEDSNYQWDDAADSWGSSQSSVDGLSAKYLYIQMELCDTKTLRAWIDEKNTPSVKKSLRDSKRTEESLTIIKGIVSGVEYIHSMKLIHRDLKPANIMFGQDKIVKIGDFGLVTDDNDDDGNLIERTVYKGTPSYMAPEQKDETTYDRKVDIFAVGLICVELLWNFSSGHERQKLWNDIRIQKFPHGFSDNFPKEYMMLRPMLCVKPENRPEASKVKKDLEEYALNKIECSRSF